MQKPIKLFGLLLTAGVILAGCSWFNQQFGVADQAATTDEGDGMMVEATDEPIKVGFIGPLTGDVAFIGENMRAAVEIAAAEINKSGGIGADNRPIQVIYEDGACDGATAANAANKLVNIDRVVAIIGGACSGETLSAAPIAEAAGVVMISGASTSPDITDAGEYIYRVIPSDSFQGSYAADLIRPRFGNVKVALMSCLADYCQGVRNNFSLRFNALGGQVVADESFPQGATDLRTQLTKVKQLEPDMIYFVGYTGETITGIRQMHELDMGDLMILGADAWSDVKIWEELGELGTGAMFTEPANQNLPQSFIDAMAAQVGGSDILVYAPRAYDALMMLASVLPQGTDGASIKAALDGLQGYPGIADTYSFDENGDVVNAVYVLRRVENGTIVDAE